MLLLVVVLASCSKKSDSVSAKPHFKVYNKGIDGNTVSNLINRLDKAIISAKPDLVIIMIGTNDVGRKLPFDQYKADLAFVIKSTKDIGADVILMSPPPRGTDIISFPAYAYNDKTDEIVKIDSALSKELGCFYIDINKLYKEAGTPNPTATSLINNAANNPDRPDGVHPTAEGMLFIASKVFDLIKSNGIGAKNANISIVCFGDSITWGMGSPLSYPSQLEILLNK